MENIFLEESQFKDIFESHTKIETYSKSIDSLFCNRRMIDRIDHAPYYQRNYVWDDSKATFFIESILLGTEIPPLIFFDEGSRIEVIDGRQRFETIKRFIDGDFALSRKGLTVLSDLSRVTMDSMRERYSEIYESFLSTKIRIIGIKLVNNPPVDPVLIDKIKKEIFGRYNSGITPLRRAEIDNAVYDSDSLSEEFKKRLLKNPMEAEKISNLFLRQSTVGVGIETIMQFIRKSLVMPEISIKAYANGKVRNELISKFYEFKYSDIENPESEVEKYIDKVNVIYDIYTGFLGGGINASRLFFEGLLWGVCAIENEGLYDDMRISSQDVIEKIISFYNDNHQDFVLLDSHYAKDTIIRYKSISKLFCELFGTDLSSYIDQNVSTKDMIDEVTPDDSRYEQALSKLEGLRITKPDPSRNKVEDIVRIMGRNRFLVRPSYQRKEVINLAKASALIESVLLGIMLPAIFVYKRVDGVSEVIDGQQRVLTLLGFLGEYYLDDQAKKAFSKNNNFKLKDLRILKHLKGSRFSDLSTDLQDKIWDFDLFIVEIDERVNPDFNPVDLFIRLNDKPFPIKEHSFEMWNSWVDKRIIDRVKKIASSHSEWVYLKKRSGKQYRDRMLNEELVSIIAYFEFCSYRGQEWKSFLDIHQKVNRINARIKKKYEITSAFYDAGRDDATHNDFMLSLEKANEFFMSLRMLLGESNLATRLDAIISSGSSQRYFSRSLQDFYLLWFFLRDISISETDVDSLREEISQLFTLSRVDAGSDSTERSFNYFLDQVESMRSPLLALDDA